MLFQKHGGQDDGDAQNAGTSDCPFFMPEIRQVHDRHMRCDGVEHMDTRQNIGRGIRRVKEAYHSDEEIVPCKSGGAQQVSVGVERAYDQKKRHAAVKEDNVSVKILPVAEEEPDEDGRDIGEPQKVRDHKIFAERDVIIQRKMNHVIRLIGASFQPDKPGDIDG